MVLVFCWVAKVPPMQLVSESFHRVLHFYAQKGTVDHRLVGVFAFMLDSVIFRSARAHEIPLGIVISPQRFQTAIAMLDKPLRTEKIMQIEAGVPRRPFQPNPVRAIDFGLDQIIDSPCLRP